MNLTTKCALQRDLPKPNEVKILPTYHYDTITEFIHYVEKIVTWTLMSEKSAFQANLPTPDQVKNLPTILLFIQYALPRQTHFPFYRRHPPKIKQYFSFYVFAL